MIEHNLATCTAIILALILSFDGSLRLPKDPNPEIIPTRISSAVTAPPIKTCSAAILSNDECSILALGGRYLPSFSIESSDSSKKMTSADVEYEGFILGLEMLTSTLLLLSSKSKSTTATTTHTCCTSSKLKAILQSNDNQVQVHVKGDCKTVIDQMNNDSLPRKQRLYYNKAKQLVQEITSNHNVAFQFEHVSRSDNILCDALCLQIVKNIQWKSVIDINKSIKMAETATAIDELNTIQKLPKSKKRRMNYRVTNYAQPLNQLANWDNGNVNTYQTSAACECSCHVPISIGPYIKCEMYRSAYQVKDYVAIRLIGESLIKESKQWQSNKLHLQNYTSIDSEELTRTCMNTSSRYIKYMKQIGYQMVYNSLKEMELNKEAEKLDLKFDDFIRKELTLTDLLQHVMKLQQEILPSWEYGERHVMKHLQNQKFYLDSCKDKENWRIPLEYWYQSVFKLTESELNDIDEQFQKHINICNDICRCRYEMRVVAKFHKCLLFLRQ